MGVWLTIYICQSERLSLYDEHANQLIREGKAYRCFCSPEDLERHKQAAHESGESTAYPGTCRNVSLEESDDRAAKGEKYAVRFKSSDKPIIIEDILYTRYRKREPEEDFIIRKRDGFPTYHFANIVDDRAMKITHVIRGAVRRIFLNLPVMFAISANPSPSRNG